MNREAVLQKLIALETSKGHLKWKVSDLSRLSGVSRPLIYYHFGRTKKDILYAAVKAIGEAQFGFGREQLVRDGGFVESVLQARAAYLANPALAVFYQKWRSQPSPLQAQLIAIERRYQQRLRRILPHLGAAQAAALHGILHGLVTAPFLSDKEVRTAVELIAPWALGVREKKA